MPFRRTTFTVLVLLAFLAGPLSAARQSDLLTCADFDSCVWAQSIFDEDPDANAALDPDGDGLVCPELSDGAAPAIFTGSIPGEAEPADLVRVVDGDTIEVETEDGDVEDARLILINTPETKDPRRPVQCFGAEATGFTTWLLSLADEVYLETDVSERDRFGRLLRYVWVEIDGEPYLVNEAIVRSGFGELSTYAPDVKCEEEIREAQQFAREYELGLWAGCGAADVPLAEVQPPPAAPAPRAPVSEPVPPPADSQPPSLGDVASVPADPLLEPAPPLNEPEPQSAASFACDPSYPNVCIPPYPPDLDCGEVGLINFAVVPPDPHGFDGDADGIGCEN